MRPLRHQIRAIAGVLFITALAGMGVSCSDKGNNSNGDIEASRYPAIKAMIQAAILQGCACLDDAFAAQFITDTAAIPGLDWPVEIPARRRDGAFNFNDSNTSWGVSYNRLVDTTRYAAFWDLGRLNAGGVIGHLDPTPAARVEHAISYARIDGSGNTQIEWGIELVVTLTGLDTDTAHVTLSLVATEQIATRCSGQPCERYEFRILNGRITKTAGVFDLSTLRGTLEADIKRTEFSAIVGYDAEFIWDINGVNTVSGTISLTSESGDFSRTEVFTLCP